ncbi:putative membrane protein [Kineococcus radiotolerans]|uniref:Putative membrane protein n=1 Tax=Kineococcus radiotolerans TaxID=131568 RepID=A0A7W4TLB4_KINRA|nr:DUF2079 domain-containing protein [Kineococcus radiotolerans]MBB2901004.1 putative membrane protein [Kineococcus radiotolerans]
MSTHVLDRAAPATHRPRTGSAVAGLLSFAWFAWLGLARWNVGRSGAYDLGVFAQSAQSWASGRLPYSAIRGLPLLGEHFSPVTALWGAAWWVWPDPRALIVVQAVPLALGVAVVHALARRHLGPPSAAVVAVLAAGSYGVVNVARLDVHEVAFAVPLIALACAALVERRLTAACAWSLPLLLVKEDQGPTICAVALVAFLLGRGRERLVAVATVLLAAAGTVAAFAVIAWRNPDHEVPLFAIRFSGEAAAAAPLTWSADGAPRLELVVVLLVTGGLVWVRSPVAFVVVPTLAWRLISPYDSYWSPRFHYDGVLMPVVFVALVDVLRRLRRPRVAVTAVVAVLSLAASTVTYLTANYVANPFSLDTWRPSAATRDLLAVSRDLPAGALVAADNGAGPYFVTRHTVRVFSNVGAVDADWVVVDLRIDGASATREGKLALVAELGARPDVEVVRRGQAVALRMPCRGPVWLPEAAGNPPLPAPVWVTGC